jgi:NHL repeat-containing protein
MRKLVGCASKGPRAAAVVALTLAWCALGVRGFAAEEASKPPPGRIGEEISRFGKEGIGPTQMTRVESVAVDPEGFIYVADWELGRVQRFSPEGKLERLVYVEPERIDAIAYERNGGVLFVVGRYRMFRYDAKALKPLGEVDRAGNGDYLTVAPRPGGGVIAVLEAPNHSDDIALLDKEGKVERIFHGAIDKVAEYMVRSPFVTMDDQGFFYVADEGNHAIFKFSPEGRYINRFGYAGHPPGDSETDFQGLAVDRQGQLWVSGWSTLNLVTPDGRPRQVYEMSAYGLAVNDKDELYVADWKQVRRYAAAKALSAEKKP